MKHVFAITLKEEEGSFMFILLLEVSIFLSSVGILEVDSGPNLQKQVNDIP